MKTKWFLLVGAMLIMGNGFCQQSNMITTAPTGLSVFTDPRGISLGNSGVASEADVFSMYYNPAKYAFIKDKTSFGLSYVPWLLNIFPDCFLASLAYAQKLGEISTIATSIRYFNQGKLSVFDPTGGVSGIVRPFDFSLDFAYSARLTEQLSLAATVRFISSKTFSWWTNSLLSASSFAGDLGIYYQRPLNLGDRKAQWSWGVSITNVGGKMNFSEDLKEFLPTTLRLGGAFKTELVKNHTLTAMLDLSKLLVPTPIAGQIPDISVLKGMIRSFYDAPGYYYNEYGNQVPYSTFKEELSEIIWSLGLEYAWKEKWFGRVGYFHESQYKGNRKYFTLGAGANFKGFGADVSYLISANGMLGTNPLSNMLSISFRYGF